MNALCCRSVQNFLSTLLLAAVSVKLVSQCPREIRGSKGTLEGTIQSECQPTNLVHLNPPCFTFLGQLFIAEGLL